MSAVSEQETFCEMLWNGRVLFGMMVFDLHQATTWLTSDSRVDPEHIGVVGMSMGATQAWWLAALDERIRLCVDICCLTDYQALIEAKAVGLHGVYYFVPRLLDHFTSAEINALIAPRARISLNGVDDPLSPNNGVVRIAEALEAAYEAAGAAGNVGIHSFRCGHQEVDEMRQIALRWIERVLVNSSAASQPTG